MIRVVVPEWVNKPSERVTFACLPLADCLIALYLLANGGESGSEAGQQRLKALRGRLSPEQMHAVTALFDAAFPLGVLVFDLLFQLPNRDDAAALVAAIRALPDIAIIEHALTCGGALSPDAPRSPGVLQSLTSDSAWAAEYIRRFLSPVPAEPERIVTAIAHPGNVRQRLVRLLDDLSTTVFPPLLATLASAAHIADARMQALYARDPAAFIAARVPGTAQTRGAQWLCWPSAFLGGGWMTISSAAMPGHIIGDPFHGLVYGTETLPESAMARTDTEGEIVPEVAPTETYQDVYRLLADPARWALIRLLVARPCYGQELSELLGLSIATVSHHLNGLKRLELVRIEREEHRLYYHLRTDRLRALLAGAEQQLLH